MTSGWHWAESVAATFDVGRAGAPLSRVDGGITHAVFRLRTTTGQYAAKRLNVVDERWWWDAYQAAARIEQAAAADGVSMPGRLPPSVAAVRDPDGLRHYWQLHHWCEGRNPTEPADDLADWTGVTLAVLHRRAGAGEQPVRPALYPFDAWCEWLDGYDTEFVHRVRPHLPTVAAALRFLGRPGPPLTPVASHRDIKPDNVLLTTAGPVLLDWDSAGPDAVEHEVLRTALAMGFERRRSFARTMVAYRRAGGRPLPPDPALFQDVVEDQIRTAEWLLWRALGHRGDDPAGRAQAATECLARLQGAAKSLRLVPEWARWLTELPG